MKTTSVSTFAQNFAMRSVIRANTHHARQRQVEMATGGRHADVGRVHGVFTGRITSLRADFARMDAMVDANKVTLSRLKISQLQMKQIGREAGRVNKAVIALKQGNRQIHTIRTVADNALGQLISSLNSVSHGSYLFSGMKVDRAPLIEMQATKAKFVQLIHNVESQLRSNTPSGDPNDYDPRRVTVEQFEAAFQQHFLNAFDMNDKWKAGWSSASDKNVRSLVARGQTVTSSVSANAKGFRQLYSAYAALSSLDLGRYSDSVQSAVLSKMSTRIAEATGLIVAERQKLGHTEAYIKDRIDEQKVTRTLINENIVDFEYQDRLIAQTLFADAQDQLKNSYQAAAQLRKLSLLNYI